jgi:hypothetical protein
MASRLTPRGVRKDPTDGNRVSAYRSISPLVMMAFAKCGSPNQVGGEFDFDISNVANYAKAYKFIVSLLLDILHAKPSDQVQEKQPIGFLFPSAPNVETEIAAFEGLGKPST